jgi:hypothetical protein
MMFKKRKREKSLFCNAGNWCFSSKPSCGCVRWTVEMEEIGDRIFSFVKRAEPDDPVAKDYAKFRNTPVPIVIDNGAVLFFFFFFVFFLFWT